ncbi:peroxisomal membrane anchor protein conserved region-domain-containing protein [Pilobolus umbonatus]|nr:peroxisomal membrane anchor protein conserved region-domain-containing protein [Pilobolus umbonatus]
MSDSTPNKLNTSTQSAENQDKPDNQLSNIPSSTNINQETSVSTDTKENNNPSVPLREDLLKQAVPFLSSPNVIPQDKAKKVAFLQKKGLTQAEIDEAFRRVGDSGSSVTSTVTYPSSQIINQTTTPTPPPRTVTQLPPQIVYYPQPPAPPVPAEKVFALAIVLGMSGFGLVAGVIGLLRKYIAPVLKSITNCKRVRYNQHNEVATRLLKSIHHYKEGFDELDEVIDQGEEKTRLDAVGKQQSDLADKINKLSTTIRDRVQIIIKDNGYSNMKTDLNNFRYAATAGDVYPNYPSNYTSASNQTLAVSGLKSEIRSIKAMLLNRRNFPTV